MVRNRKAPIAPHIYPRMLDRPSPRDAEVPTVPIYRLTVAQYEKMVEVGILTKDDRVELWDGWIVPKYSQSPRHAYAASVLRDRLHPMLGDDWWIRIRTAIVCHRSVLEPDIALVRENPKFTKRWPRASEAELVIEISDVELPRDRDFKLIRYAAGKIPQMWLVNLIDRRVEVYTKPRGGKKPGYDHRDDYSPGSFIAVRIERKAMGKIEVNDLLP